MKTKIIKTELVEGELPAPGMDLASVLKKLKAELEGQGISKIATLHVKLGDKDTIAQLESIVSDDAYVILVSGGQYFSAGKNSHTYPYQVQIVQYQK